MIQANWLKAAAATVAVLAPGHINAAYGADRAPATQIDADADPADDSHGHPQRLARAGDDDAAEVVGTETIHVTLPARLHRHGLAVPARLVRPRWSKKVGPRPAMLVLHGSGGLTRMPKHAGEGDGPCSHEMEPQYERWAERLAERGYVVLLPSSYEARGFCDMHVDTARIPETFDDRPEAVLGRLYDVDAASRWLCDRPEVDCDRMGLLGFSHGATMVLLALHWQIDHMLDRYREHFGHAIDIPIPDLAPGRPEFQVGVAYYPGCGFDGVIPLATDRVSSVFDKYHPTAPIHILHGDDDPLVKHCSERFGPGTRPRQSAQVAAHIGADDPFAIDVYHEARHGFDNAGGSGKDEKSSNSPADVAARDKALKVALDELDRHLR